MKEFALKGFRNASTDIIAKEANISKGALFHYFNSKKDLFLFLYDYSINTLKNEMFMKLNFKQKDIFARIREVSLLKLEILKKHPQMYDFILTAYMENSDDVKYDLESKNKALIAENQYKIYEDIDTAKFKEEVDAKRAINIIAWTVEGFTNREMEKIKHFSFNELNFSKMMQELDTYLEILKKSFYKQV